MNLIHISGAILSLILILSASSCKPKQAAQVETKPVESQPAVADPMKPTFSTNIQPIIETYCGGYGCHHGSPSEWLEWNKFARIVESGRFEKMVLIEKSMPPKSTIDVESMALLKRWHDSGYPK